jgi:HlyD family secretion protein
MKLYKFLFITIALFTISCNRNDSGFDATGNFEADEIIVSAEANGKILELNIEEGSELKKQSMIGIIDTMQLHLRKIQLQYSIKAVNAKQPNIHVQLAAIEYQIETAEHEKNRVVNLLKDDAATQKQLDDLNSQIDVLKSQYHATESTLNITKQSLQSETLPLKAQLEQIEDLISKSVIVNPIDGIVLAQYAKQNEVVNQGKALYKIADLSNILLRVYISGSQLSQIKLGQKVKVLVDAPDNSYKEYPGTISWVSDKAEFTPKTIQTKDERANLVYAVKINVKNDGYLKLGMYGEVKFN